MQRSLKERHFTEKTVLLRGNGGRAKLTLRHRFLFIAMDQLPGRGPVEKLECVGKQVDRRVVKVAQAAFGDDLHVDVGGGANAFGRRFRAGEIKPVPVNLNRFVVDVHHKTDCLKISWLAPVSLPCRCV